MSNSFSDLAPHGNISFVEEIFPLQRLSEDSKGMKIALYIHLTLYLITYNIYVLFLAILKYYIYICMYVFNAYREYLDEQNFTRYRSHEIFITGIRQFPTTQKYNN